MAEAKKCDRCGDFYIEVEACIFENAIKAINDLCEYIDKPEESTKAKKFVSEIEKHLDLCGDCAKSLKKWFFRKGETGGI